MMECFKKKKKYVLQQNFSANILFNQPLDGLQEINEKITLEILNFKKCL